MAGLVAVLALSACGGDDSDTAASSATAPPTIEAAAEAGDGGLAIGDTNGDVNGSAPSDPGTGSIDLGSIGRDVIIEMHVVVASDDIRRAVAVISASAASLGGGIASSDVNYPVEGEPGGGGYAVVVVRVPPDEVTRLLSGLEDTGDVRSINQTAQDVTEQLVDLDVRIENARQSVTNVRAFMDKTENLSELVTLEAELTRRQTELEQLEAQQRNLGDRVAFSTVTIEVVPTDSIPEPAEDKGIGDAFGDGWHAFTSLMFGLGYAIAVIAPFLVAGAVLALIAWRVVRRRRPTAAANPAPDDRAGTTLPPPDSGS